MYTALALSFRGPTIYERPIVGGIGLDFGIHHKIFPVEQYPNQEDLESFGIAPFVFVKSKNMSLRVRSLYQWLFFCEF